MGTYPGLLDQCTQPTEQMHQQVHDACAFNSLLLADLLTHAQPAPDVQEGHELRESIQHTALAELLCVLPKDVAVAEVGDDAWRC